MILDLLFLALIVLSTWTGYRRGFVLSVIKTFGWIVGIWIAAKWASGLSVYVRLFMNTQDPFTERTIGFIAALIIVKLAYFAITLLLSKKHHAGDIIGFADSVAGSALGLISGILMVLVAVIAIPALADLFGLDTLADMFASSRGAGYLFSNNPLLGILDRIGELETINGPDMEGLKNFAEDKLDMLRPVIKKLLNR